EPTADMRRLAEADALLICVPTPLNETRDPDLTYIENTARQIAKVLRPGQLIVLESTTYPGTTREVVLPILSAGGLKAGEDFFLAFSPEREDPGNPKYSTESIPKVVGGIDHESGRLAALLYANAVVKVVSVSNCEIAEAAKIIENTYRSVNIAMVNEMKMLFDRMGIDVWEVIEAAKTKPFGFQAFGEINTFMPRYVVSRLQEALNDKGKPLQGSKICVLGVAYKKDVDDPRESPSFELMELLLAGGAIISYNDPHVPVLPKMRHYRRLPAMNSIPLTPEFLAGLDCVLIATDHSAYDYDLIVRNAPLIIDTRNATKNVTQFRDKIRKA
ncbi:MAG: nucleotide sugar dehydrogenase, partial [Thermoguttaceae bacterium]